MYQNTPSGLKLPSINSESHNDLWKEYCDLHRKDLASGKPNPKNIYSDQQSPDGESELRIGDNLKGHFSTQHKSTKSLMIAPQLATPNKKFGSMMMSKK